MTLRGVIQGLVHGSGDAEAALAENGYGDLPAEMFGQALASYADTAPMEEADALSPILTTIDAGHASDAFAVFEEQPPVVDPSGGADLAGVGVSLVGVDAFGDDLDLLDNDSEAVDDEALDEFGDAAPDADELADGDIDVALDLHDDADDALEDTALFGSTGADEVEPSFDDADAEPDTAGDFEALEDFFDTEPIATGDDPSDLDF